MFDTTTTLRLCCDSCGERLTRAEDLDPIKFKVYFEALGKEFFTERIMCSFCASDFIASGGKGLRSVSSMTSQLRHEHEQACYNAVSSTYPFRKVTHI